MRTADYYMISFESTLEAISAERYLGARLGVCTMPTLRSVTASCGISLRVEAYERAVLKQALSGDFPVSAQAYRLYHVTQAGPVPVQPEALR